MTQFIVIVLISLFLCYWWIVVIYNKKLTCPKCKHVRKHSHRMIWFCPKNDKFVCATEDISKCKFKDIETNIK